MNDTMTNNPITKAIDERIAANVRFTRQLLDRHAN